jgi:hypothetical protein
LITTLGPDRLSEVWAALDRANAAADAPFPTHAPTAAGLGIGGDASLRVHSPAPKRKPDFAKRLVAARASEP